MLILGNSLSLGRWFTLKGISQAQQIPLSPFLKNELIRFWFFVLEERYDSGIAREYR
jgi:hypothetical protein